MRKTEKYICVFAIVAGFVASYVVGYRYGIDDKDNTIIRQDESERDEQNQSTTFNDNEMSTTDVSSDDRVLQRDAILVMEVNHEEADIDFETMEMKLPVDLIGMSREEVIDYVKNNGKVFVDEDEELINVMLVSFGESRIVLRKNVREGQVIIYPKGESEQYNYYIGIKDNKVVVFKKDKTTVFIETGITYDMVDIETRAAIEEGVWIENITALYRYLESITS